MYPFNYELINSYAGRVKPSQVKAFNNKAYAFWCRSLFQRACSTIELNLPEDWQGSVKDYFYYILLKDGFLSVFEDKRFGFIFQPCTLKGQNLWYQPTNALVSNPAIPNTLDMEIGKDCEIVKLTPDYQGIFDLISHYALKLALMDDAIDMSLINNKYGLMIGARNKSSAMALEKMFDKINSGEPAVFFDSGIIKDNRDDHEPFIIIDRKLKENYITSEQLQDAQTILNAFDAEVGIPTIPYQKKERMVSTEADSRLIDSTARSAVWVDCLNDTFDVVNKHFGTNMSASLRFERGEDDEHSNIDIDRDVQLSE